MTDTNQKLREALHKAKAALSLALSDVDWRKDSLTQPVIHKAYNCAHEALALPPDVPETTFRGMREALQLIAWSNDSKWQADCARQALALPTAEQVDDINVAESFTSVTKTAAPVGEGEREAFEQVIVEAVGSGAIRRWPNEKGESYENARVQDYRQGWLWGIEWQARAALSAGDAVDAQRLDFIEKSARCDPKMDGQHVWWPTSLNKAIKGPTLRAAIDAAMRKDNL